MSLAKYMMQETIGYEPPNATVLETVTLPVIAAEYSRGIAFDPSGNLILVTVSSSGSYVGRIRTYDGFSATQVGSFIQFPGNPRYLEHIRFDESGDLIAINSGFNTYNPGVLAKYDGKSNTQLSAFNTAHRAIGAMEIVEGDIVWCDQTGTVRRQDGFSNTVLSSWTTFSGGYPAGMTFDGRNLIASGSPANKMEISNGVGDNTLFDSVTLDHYVTDFCFFDGHVYTLQYPRTIRKLGKG